MIRSCLAARGASMVALAVLLASPARASEIPAGYRQLVARYAQQHGVPERLIHRIIMRESRYNPGVISKGNYGLMQIRLGTARGMGYRGGAQGLLDPDVNMRHAVPYLANAYRVAHGNEDLAVRYYAGGYYYAAKRQGLLDKMRNASSSPAAASRAPGKVQAQGKGQEQGEGGAQVGASAGASAVAPSGVLEKTQRSARPAARKVAARRAGPSDASPVPPARPADIDPPQASPEAPASPPAPPSPDIVRD